VSTLHYRLRIRTADDSADLFAVSSVPSDRYPYIAEEPDGDGSTLDPVEGRVTVGAYTVQVVDAVAVETPPTGTLVTDGWEYADQAAAESAGWVFSNTLTGASLTVGATDQFYSGSRSLKFTTTGSGALAGSGALRATKVFDGSDGVLPNTTYRVTVRARLSARSWYDADHRYLGAADGHRPV
jgi:hypothetical protein